MRIVYPLFMFLATNTIIVYFFKVPFGKALPFTLIIDNLLFYILGIIFYNLLLGYRCLIVLSAFSLLIWLYALMKKEKMFFKNYLSIGLIVSIVFFALVVYLNWERGFNYIDEYNFWGFLSKEAYRLKDFYFVDGSNAYFNTDYPPFYTLFETLWCFCMAEFKDCYCYQALTFFSLSLYLPLFEIKRDKKILSSILLMLISVLIRLTINKTDGMVYSTLFYNSIYIDLHVGCLVGFGFFMLLSFDFSRWYSYVAFSIYLSALIMTKQISIVFVLLLLVSLVVKMYIEKLMIKENKLKLLLNMAPFVLYLSWTYMLNKYNVISKFSSNGFDYLVIIKYILKHTNEYESNIISGFIKAFFTRSIIIKPIGISYFFLILIFSLAILVYALKNKNDKFVIYVSILYFLGGLGYAYAMMVSYVYGFSVSEAPGLIMFDRYMLTYIITGLFLSVSLYLRNKNTVINSLVIMVLLVSMISKETVSLSSPQLEYNGQKDFFSERFNYLLYEYDINDNLLVVHQGDILRNCALRFLIDKKIEYNDYSFVYDEEISLLKNVEIMKNQLSKYEYIYLAFVDDDLIGIWNNFNGDVPKQDHLYKVIKENDGVYLEALFNDW